MPSHRLTAVCLLALLGLAGTGAAPPPQNTEREILQRFQQQIDEYMEIHRRFEKDLPPVKPQNPAEVSASQKALAAKIRLERKNPVPGAIFTPVTRTIFRRRLQAQLTGPDGAAIRQLLTADTPRSFPLRVNAEYPRGWPLSSVPPAVLAALPKLPDDLEYRFVGRDMILLDVHANLIVDFIKDAIR